MCSCKNKKTNTSNQETLTKSFVNQTVNSQKNNVKKTREELLAELRRRMFDATR